MKFQMRKQSIVNGINMIYEIVISKHNQKPHLDIQAEASRIKNGLFTFVIRVAADNIVDVVFLSYESYQSFKDFTELGISYSD